MYRKSRVEAPPARSLSMLPKRLTPSLERRSAEARRASQRSSSAEPARAGGPRLSRDASASKIPLNRKSKSQQGLADRHYSSSMTPLRNSAYARPTTTPVRTPSQDRGHSWQASVERALSFVTHRDLRPVSDVSWQRAAHARVAAALAARGPAGGQAGGGLALIRPLTIARFVDICSGLLQAIGTTKLSTENYVAKLPNQAKRFLYPGAVSKSWLKTVNTLHAFPHALAIIAYLLDFVDHIELPVSEEWLYRDKDAVSALRRDHLTQCWLRFERDCDFQHLDQEYVQRLAELLGDDTQRIQHLEADIQELEACLADPAEEGARAEEERARGRREALAGAGRALRLQAAQLRETRAQAEDCRRQRENQARQLDQDIASHTAAISQLKAEVSSQPLSVSERAQLAAEAQYAAKVADSKRSLAEQLANMVSAKESELSEWQQRALDSCVQYKRALIHLSARHPHLSDIAVDEKDLMSESCAECLSRGVAALREVVSAATERRLELERARGQRLRTTAKLLEEARASVSELESAVERESGALEAEAARDGATAGAWVRAREELHARRELLLTSDEDISTAQHSLDHWQRQDHLWRRALSSLCEYSAALREDLSLQLEAHKRSTAARVRAMADHYHQVIDDIDRDQ